MHPLKITAAVTVVLVATFFSLPYLVDQGKEPAMQKACEARIRALSHNPTTVKLGTPTILAASDTTTQFTWTPDELQMQNGFGAMLGVKAVCVADRNTREVVELRMD